jgi:predicted transcriptional regulator
MMNKKTARKYTSNVITQLLSETTPVEALQTNTKMTQAARLDDLITERGWDKNEFAEKVNKNPSEITKWLSGTQNFTLDTLAKSEWF